MSAWLPDRLQEVAMVAPVALLVALALWAWRRRDADRPACPRCGYSARSGEGVAERCSECGFEPSGRRPWRWGWRRSRLAIAALVAVVSLLGWRYGPAAWPFVRRLVVPRYATVGDVTIGDHRVRLVRDRWFDWGERAAPTRYTFEVLDRRDGRTFRQHAFHVEVGLAGARDALPAPGTRGFGDDVDDDGVPDVVLALADGGSGGHGRTFVVSLGGDLAATSALEDAWLQPGGASGTPATAVVGDRRYRYRWTSGAGSPSPTLLFAPREGLWELDVDACRARAPDAAALGRARAAVAAGMGSREAWLSPLLTATLDLVYAGRAAEGQALLRELWREDEASRLAFEEELARLLREPPSGDALRAINGGDPWP